MDNDRHDDGFSSNQDEKEEIIHHHNPFVQPAQELKYEQLTRQALSPPMEIQRKSYSLQPDISTGWKPKIVLPKPIPLRFTHEVLDEIINFLIKATKNDEMVLCYLGPRFSSTYHAWKLFIDDFPYNHHPQQKLVMTDRQFLGHNKELIDSDCLIFDSLFESGNLDCAFKVGAFEYDLFMRVDSNTRGHLQWYNFKVTNLRKDIPYRFNICNFQKQKSLYSRGMKPYILSFIDKQKGWSQQGQNITYDRKIPKIFKYYNIDNEESLFLKLSFTVKTSNFNDTLHIAYCVPYTYSNLLTLLNSLKTNNQDRDIITQTTLTNTFGAVPVPLLTLTHQSSQQQASFKDKIPHCQRKLIFIIGRIHPGQSNGSYIMQGLLNFLTSISQQADLLLKTFVFKIIPMANPDGVIIGNYRTGLSGRDFNRQFIDPDESLFPQNHALKKYLLKCKSTYQHNFFLFLDLHGHSIKKNIFAYGPQFPIINPKYYQTRLLPKLISKYSSMFRYYSCIFKISNAKMSTARAILIRNYGIFLTYTIEASNGCFYDSNIMRDVPFNDQMWIQAGQNIGKALTHYAKIFIQMEATRQAKKKERQKTLKSQQRKRIHSSTVRSYQAISKSKRLLVETNFDQHFSQLFQEIKDQKQPNVCCSDDQLSEGKSDSEQSQDDLTPQQMAQLIRNLNPKKAALYQKKQSNCKILKNFKQNNSQFEADAEEEEKNRKEEKKEVKKIFLKRKAHNISGTPSPTKQPIDNIAKIINFNFVLNPIQVYNPKKQHTEPTEIQRPRQPQYSQSFRKTFLSVQRDMIRKQNNKRINFSFWQTNRPVRMQQIIGRRIFTQSSH